MLEIHHLSLEYVFHDINTGKVICQVLHQDTDGTSYANNANPKIPNLVLGAGRRCSFLRRFPDQLVLEACHLGLGTFWD